jgi:hypothetical protein
MRYENALLSHRPVGDLYHASPSQSRAGLSQSAKPESIISILIRG